MAAFYRAVGGNYDSFFADTPPTSISWIYASIGCEHILLPTNDSYVPPSIPSLTMAGFVRWQCIEILLGPEEHVPYIQESLRLFDIRHPETNIPFPTDLPTDAFPLIPDQATEQWHENCAKLLRLRSITAEKEKSHSSSKPKHQNTNSVHEDSYIQENFSSCSKKYEQPSRKTRVRPANFRCFSNLNVRSALSPDDLGLREIVVEVESKASRKSRQQNSRRNSLPTWAKEQRDKSSEIPKTNSGGEFSTKFGTINNKPKFFHSRHSHNYEDEIASRLSNSARHFKVEAEKKPFPRSLRLSHQTRYPTSDFSTQNSRGKSSPKTEEDYIRFKQVRNISPEMKISEKDNRHLYSSHNEYVIRKNIVPVVADPDNIFIENIRESFKSRTFSPNIDRETNSSLYVGKKKTNFDEIQPCPKFQD